ncbi:arsenic transporter [Chitinasiproducens palmae]|nr:arsenic transporter [Chitinasiproducens palmae]
MLLALSIFVVTLVLVVWQPFGLGVGWSATFGAVLALLTGVIGWSDVPTVWHIVWNATGTFIALIVISLLLEAAGSFEWAARHVARWGRGRGSLLFVAIILLGAAVSTVFANDGAALILTPIVVAMLLALRFPPQATLAFVFATGFVADSASLPLVVSNLVNIVSADFFHVDAKAYAAVMVPVDLASIAATLLVLYLFFRRDIPARYALDGVATPASAIRDRPTFIAGWVVLALLLAGLFATEAFGIPVSALALVCAVALIVVAARSRAIETRRILASAPWHIVVFSLGMYLVVYGLRNAGLTAWLSRLLDQFAAAGVWGAAFGTGVTAALLSSVMNNLPSVLVGALAIDGSHATGAVRTAMVYANLIGADIGPKITPIGSLATLLWLHVLAGKGVRIGWLQYCRVGLVLVPPVLVAALAALAWRLAP